MKTVSLSFMKNYLNKSNEKNLRKYTSHFLKVYRIFKNNQFN